jgi:hypothetical protein
MILNPKFGQRLFKHARGADICWLEGGDRKALKRSVGLSLGLRRQSVGRHFGSVSNQRLWMRFSGSILTKAASCGGPPSRACRRSAKPAKRTVVSFVAAHFKPGSQVREVELHQSFPFPSLGKQSNLPPSTVPLLSP